jgi:hypothetical protein
MHHLPSSRGTRLLLYYVLTWRSVEKPKEKKIGENSSFGVLLLVGSASQKGQKIFVNGVKSLLGNFIPVMDSTLDHGFIRFHPCLLLIKVSFFGNALF